MSKSKSVCDNKWLQNRATAKWESDLVITSVIKDRIGQQEVLLPIDHNHYNLLKKNQFI